MGYCALELLSDEDLLAHVRAGRVEVFEVVMRRHNPRVYRAVRAILRNEDEAIDVVQEAYVRAFAHLAELAKGSSFATWLTRIAVHEAYARRRRQQRLEPLDAENREEFMISASRGPEQDASDGELRIFLEQAVDALPEHFRIVFVLRAVEQMSVAETAEVLGIPEDTVKTRLFRARERLQAILLEEVGQRLPFIYGFHCARCDRVVAVVLMRLRMSA